MSFVGTAGVGERGRAQVDSIKGGPELGGRQVKLCTKKVVLCVRNDFMRQMLPVGVLSARLYGE